MSSMKDLYLKFLKNVNAATAIEYSLVAAAIALAIIVVVFLAGGEVDDMFTTVSDTFSSQL